MKFPKSVAPRLFANITLISFLIIFNCCSSKNDSFRYSGAIDIQISNSYEFGLVLHNLKLIKEHPRKEFWDISFIELTNKSLNQFDNDSKCQIFLDELGIVNSTLLFNRIFEMDLNISNIFSNYPQLYRLNQNKILEIFRSAYSLRKQKKSNLIQLEFELDECSNNYATSIEGCSDALAWDLVGAGIGGVLALGGTPIASTGTVLALAGVAYFKEYNCKVNAVNQWKACRVLHPISR
jgi:hypothetical protein